MRSATQDVDAVARANSASGRLVVALAGSALPADVAEELSSEFAIPADKLCSAAGAG